MGLSRLALLNITDYFSHIIQQIFRYLCQLVNSCHWKNYFISVSWQIVYLVLYMYLGYKAINKVVYSLNQPQVQQIFIDLLVMVCFCNVFTSWLNFRLILIKGHVMWDAWITHVVSCQNKMHISVMNTIFEPLPTKNIM